LKEFYNEEHGCNPNDKMWPQSDKAIGNKIRESMMGLKNSGIEVLIDEKQTDGVNYYTIRALDKIPAENRTQTGYTGYSG